VGPVVKTLLTAAQDQASGVRSAAVRALAGLRIPAEQVEPVVKTLLTAAQHQDSDVREAAVGALGRLPIPAEQVEPVVKTLLTAAQDQNSNVRSATVGALGQLIVPAEQLTGVVDALMPSTVDATDATDELRSTASDSIGRIWLAGAQKDPNSTVYLSLLQRLRTEDKSRLNAGYRRALVSALAYWYNAGQDDAGKDNPFAEDRRARQEHVDLQNELEKLRDTGPLWLRVAAAEVWMTAYELRRGR